MRTTSKALSSLPKDLRAKLLKPKDLRVEFKCKVCGKHHSSVEEFGRCAVGTWRKENPDLPKDAELPPEIRDWASTLAKASAQAAAITASVILEPTDLPEEERPKLAEVSNIDRLELPTRWVCKVCLPNIDFTQDPQEARRQVREALKDAAEHKKVRELVDNNIRAIRVGWAVVQLGLLAAVLYLAQALNFPNLLLIAPVALAAFQAVHLYSGLSVRGSSVIPFSHRVVETGLFAAVCIGAYITGLVSGA